MEKKPIQNEKISTIQAIEMINPSDQEYNNPFDRFIVFNPPSGYDMKYELHKGIVVFETTFVNLFKKEEIDKMSFTPKVIDPNGYASISFKFKHSRRKCTIGGNSSLKFYTNDGDCLHLVKNVKAKANSEHTSFDLNFREDFKSGVAVLAFTETLPGNLGSFNVCFLLPIANGNNPESPFLTK